MTMKANLWLIMVRWFIVAVTLYWFFQSRAFNDLVAVFIAVLGATALFYEEDDYGDYYQ